MNEKYENRSKANELFEQSKDIKGEMLQLSGSRNKSKNDALRSFFSIAIDETFCFDIRLTGQLAMFPGVPTFDTMMISPRPASAMKRSFS